MNKLICVTNKKVADGLVELGYHYMIQQLNGHEIYTFAENGELIDLLNNKEQYDKKHWYIDKCLRF